MWNTAERASIRHQNSSNRVPKVPVPCLLRKTGLKVRRACPRDLPRLLSIEERSHPAPWDEGGFLEEIQDQLGIRHLWVAVPVKRPERILAYVCFHYLGDHVYILNLTVCPEYRRKGLGRAMLYLVCQWARARRGCDSVALEVRADNLAALSLYQGAGFKKVGEFKTADGYRAFRLTRSLEKMLRPPLE